jgi:translation initiation factor 3 subunit G
MRAGAGRGAGESMYRSGMNRDDMPTLRVTNVSEDTQEDDLRELFTKYVENRRRYRKAAANEDICFRFGRVARVYIGRDRETGIGKGYAFVSFEEKANAERAIQKVHGMGAWLSFPHFGHHPMLTVGLCRVRQLDFECTMVA